MSLWRCAFVTFWPVQGVNVVRVKASPHCTDFTTIDCVNLSSNADGSAMATDKKVFVSMKFDI